MRRIWAQYKECKINKNVGSALKSGSVGDGKQDICVWCLMYTKHILNTFIYIYIFTKAQLIIGLFISYDKIVVKLERFGLKKMVYNIVIIF